MRHQSPHDAPRRAVVLDDQLRLDELLDRLDWLREETQTVWKEVLVIHQARRANAANRLPQVKADVRGRR